MWRALPLVLISWAAAAYEGARVEVKDAGVHVPVLTKAPALLEFVQADYPPEATDAGVAAAVHLKVTLGADGSVTDAEVTQPVGFGFDEAAAQAVRRFRFSPAEIDNVPAAVQLEYVYNFVLQVPDAGTPDPDAGVAIKVPTATLKGTLIVRGSRTRLPGGIVRCENLPDAGDTTADDDGQFSFTVPAGECKVVVSAGGYHPFHTDETLEPDEIREVKYFVLSKTVGYETVIRDKKDKKEVVNRTLSRTELQKIPGTFGDPIRVIQNFPGVARAPFFGGQLVVRGANPNQTLFFLDGVQVPLLFHFGGGPSVISAEFIDKIDFYPGGFGARYGRAVGGAVDVQTRKGSADAWHVVANADLQGAAAFVEAPITDKVSVAGSVRRSYIDALLPLVLPKDPEGGTLLVVPQYWDYQVRIDYGTRRGQTSVAGASTFSLMAFGSDDVLRVVATGMGLDADFSLSFHTLFHRLVGTWTYRGPNATLKLVPWAGYDLASIDLGILRFDANRYTLGVRADLEVELASFLTLRAGADIFDEHLIGEAKLPVLSGDQYVGFPGAEPKTETQRIAQSPDTFDGALYLEADARVGPVTLTPGVRASHAVIYGQTLHAFDPRLWLRYHAIKDWTTIKGSVGLYTQPPAAFNMAPAPLGNPGLKHEKAFQSSLGVSQKITENINVDVTGYFNRRYENVGPGERTVNPDGSVTQLRSGNTAYGTSYGLEVLLRHEVTKNFFGWVAYTFSRSVEGVNGGDVYIGPNDQTHNLIVVGSYRIPLFCSREVACGGWEFGGRFRLVSGNPTTPLMHQYDLYRNDANAFSSMRGPFRSARQPTFHQLDLRLDKNFVFDRWTLGLYLDVQNVYNQRNIEGTITDYRARQEYTVPGIPILPILGVKASL
ncbi:MAG: TonB family protein [Archangiaceae bacterium]|nr:TonB family protein [Archangiaceae bacterium]